MNSASVIELLGFAAIFAGLAMVNVSLALITAGLAAIVAAQVPSDRAVFGAVRSMRQRLSSPLDRWRSHKAARR